MIGLGLDGGGTGSRWRLLDEKGAVLGEGTTGALTGHLFDEPTRAKAQQTVQGLAAAVRAAGRPQRIIAGIAGLSAGTDTAHLLASWLAAAFGLGTGAVQVTDDMHIAYRAAFNLGEGILVYAGTGSIAVHLTKDGKAERAGGHGYLIDDAGSGFWIGQRALRAMLHAEDERRDGGALAQELCSVTGSEWSLIRSYVYGGGRAAVAALVPAVAKAALRDDEVATTILSTAGEELGRLARVLLARIGPQPVALSGGVTRASPLILSHFKAALPRDAVVRQISQAPVETAARLAAEGAWA
jgi:N-acetylglucosamine kinase-like BadF-type ATPase